MSDYDRGLSRPVPADRADMAVDAGLRSFMLGVYNKVALGLIWSAAMAWLTSSYAPVRDLLYRTQMGVGADGEPVLRLAGMTTLGMIVAFAPLAILLFSAVAIRNQSPRTAGIMYWTIVTLIGASLGTLVFVYTGASIATTFLITATAFGGLSLIGYTTKKDLSGLGSFLIIGLIGLVIASLVNMFLRAPMLHFIVNLAGVGIFAGLIAVDTQRLKMIHYELGDDAAARGVATNYAALNLYLDFINLFRFLLYFLGQRR